MQTIRLSLECYKGAERIFVPFDYEPSIVRLIKKTPGAKYSGSKKCWHIPAVKEYAIQLVENLKGFAKFDTSYLKQQLLNRQSLSLVQKNVSYKPDITQISRENTQAFNELVQTLALKCYSPSTIRTYRNEFYQLLKQLNHIPVQRLDPEHIKRYVFYCIDRLHLSEATIHSRINAIKFYFEEVLHRQRMFIDIPRPKKPLQLPKFFNPDEIASIIRSATNIKHKTMLMLAYSAGLRVSEVVRIKTGNNDSKRMCIFIENSKGKKDRIVNLSPVLLVMLREYWRAYKPLRSGYLFPGQIAGEAYSTRSLQLILNAAKLKAGVIKAGSIHALRHSFATHLLDKGTDVTMIMKLLGHNDIKTTLRYLHITNRDILRIVSPLDELNL